MNFSRFPFSFPCTKCNANTVISCLKQLFTLFGTPSFVHSDRGQAFLSRELISFLPNCGNACSKTSIYNAQGNDQCERYNDVIWNTVKLALKSGKLDICQWECVYDVLHSISLLLCSAYS